VQAALDVFNEVLKWWGAAFDKDDPADVHVRVGPLLSQE
jgi:hypothetical protein